MKEKSYSPKKACFYFKPSNFLVKEIKLMPSYYTLYYYLLYSIIINITESVEPSDKDNKLKGLSQVLWCTIIMQWKFIELQQYVRG